MQVKLWDREGVHIPGGGNRLRDGREERDSSGTRSMCGGAPAWIGWGCWRIRPLSQALACPRDSAERNVLQFLGSGRFDRRGRGLLCGLWQRSSETECPTRRRHCHGPSPPPPAAVCGEGQGVLGPVSVTEEACWVSLQPPPAWPGAVPVLPIFLRATQL